MIDFTHNFFYLRSSVPLMGKNLGFFFYLIFTFFRVFTFKTWKVKFAILFRKSINCQEKKSKQVNKHGQYTPVTMQPGDWKLLTHRLGLCYQSNS